MTLTVTSPPVSSPPFLMTEGQEVNLFPVSSEVTLSQVARFLKISENHLNNLLDAGKIEVKTRFIGGERVSRNPSNVRSSQGFQ